MLARHTREQHWPKAPALAEHHTQRDLDARPMLLCGANRVVCVCAHIYSERDIMGAARERLALLGSWRLQRWHIYMLPCHMCLLVPPPHPPCAAQCCQQGVRLARPGSCAARQVETTTTAPPGQHWVAGVRVRGKGAARMLGIVTPLRN